jgi:uncharacterized delta-60 repeat protein
MHRHTSRKGLALEPLEAREVPAVIGSLDPSFGTDGKVLTTGVPLAAVKAQPDGKIVVAGTTAGTDFLVARYNPDGTLDTSFDGDGIATVDLGSIETATGLAIQSDGKVVIVGSSGSDFGVARLNSDGSLDTSFSADGKLTVDFGGTDVANAVAVQPDGKIVVAGTNGIDFALARINPADGSLDTGFGTGGKATFDITGGVDAANALAIQGDGMIVVAGTGSGNFAVARVKTDGSALDPVFDTDGKQTVDFGGTDAANAVAIDPAGNVLLAGTNGADIAVARLTAVGAPDTTFDADGKQTVDAGTGADTAKAVFVLADGKLLLAGNTASDLAIVRLNPNGSLDGSFATGGKATVDVNGAGDTASAAIITAEGRLVTAGASAANGALSRELIELDDTRNVAVGGSLDGKAQVFTPNPATAQLNGTALATVSAFGTTSVNARVAIGDVNGDGIEDTILITGPHTAARLAVVSGADNTTLLVAPFDPFGGNFTGGGFVSAADFDNDGRVEVVATPDQGGGPRVVIFSLAADGTTFGQKASFFGIDDPGFRGGARSGTGDVDGDGFADLAVAAGFQGGPRVALFDGATLFTTQQKLIADFFAFDPVLRNGTYVAIGDIDGDGFGDLIFGAGPGGAPRVLGISGQTLLTTGAVAAIASPLTNFFVAGNANDRGGVRVSTADVDGDNKAEVVVGSGEFETSRVRVYYGKNFGVSGEPAGFQDLNPFSGTTFADGIFVG